MKKVISTGDAPAAIGPYSQAIMIDGVLYASGQIPVDPKTGEIAGSSIEEQAEQVMKNIDAILKAAGMEFENVVKTTCFLSDMQNFSSFNEIYGKYFVSRPARSCVAVKEIPKQVLCEVEILAYK